MRKYLTVIQAFETVTGQRPNPSTCWRWAQKGSQGVFLQTWMIGGRRKTTIEAVERFIKERSELAPNPRDDSPARGWVSEELRKELGL